MSDFDVAAGVVCCLIQDYRNDFLEIDDMDSFLIREIKNNIITCDFDVDMLLEAGKKMYEKYA